MLRAGKIVKSGIFIKIILRNKAFADCAQGWSGQCSRIFAFAASDKIGQLRRMAAAEYKSTMTCLSEVSSNSDLCGINGE